jgi:hypothetical protein
MTVKSIERTIETKLAQATSKMQFLLELTDLRWIFLQYKCIKQTYLVLAPIVIIALCPYTFYV